MSLGLSVFIILAVFATSILSGAIGMAGGMILMGLLAWQLPVQQAMMVHATAQFTANASRAFMHRKHIYTKSLAYYYAGLGVVFFAFSLAAFVTDKMLLFFLLGIGPFVTRALPEKMRLDFTKPRHAFLCGGIVTFFQLTSGVGGPMLDAFFQNRALTRHQTVATKAFTQAVAHAAKFAYFGLVVSSFAESFAGVSLVLCGIIMPVAIFGTHLGRLLLEKMTDHQFYRATQILLLGIGGIYLLKAAQLWLTGA